jgi:SAM-dependent methyltransferase
MRLTKDKEQRAAEEERGPVAPLERVRRFGRKALWRVRRIDTLEYWRERTDELGANAVVNQLHRSDDLDELTRKEEELLFPYLRNALNGSEATLLDFGCGTGRFTTHLAELIDGTAVGVDPTASLLAHATPGERTRFLQIGASQIPFPDGSFDVIWVCLVLGGITRPAPLLRTAQEIERVLAPGGLLFLIENTSERPNAKHWSFRSADEYEQLFEGVDLVHKDDYQADGERMSILSGRARAGG